MNRRFVSVMVGIVFFLNGCTLAPEYTKPKAPIPAQWPQGEAYKTTKATQGTPTAPQLGWKEFFTDPKLQAVIKTALDNNRDLKLAALNVERARAMYGIRRAELFPSISGNASWNKQKIPPKVMGFPQKLTLERYDVSLGISSWEIDFFGRIRNLKKQALEEYLATDEARRAAQVSLISGVARAYLALGADRENLKLARSTLTTRQAAYDLIKQQYDVGIATGMELRQAQVRLDAARGDVARYTQVVALDKNALCLLVGATVTEELLPQNLSDITPPEKIFAGISSEILLNRPDIISAEHRLKGAYAYIGAARAAFFPSISLTTSVGTASDELSGLFDSGNGTWSFTPQIKIPVFDPRTWAAYRVSKAEQKIALAQYEKTIQAAFREVADALATQGTVEQQLTAQQSLTNAVADTYDLSYKRYKEGIDSYINVLDAQQSLYAAREGLVSLRLAELANKIKLYAALGGGRDRDETAQDKSEKQKD